MPGLNRLLKKCREASIRLGIISNAQFYTRFLFDWLLGRDLIQLGFDPDLVIFSYEHKRAKPDSYLFELARDRLANQAIAPERTAYVGNDIRNDILPAVQVGFQTILFAGDQRSLRLRRDDPACRSIKPDMVITELTQLGLNIP